MNRAMARNFHQKVIAYGVALAGVAFMTALYKAFITGVNATTVALSLLLVVLAIASRYGLGPSIAASIAGMLCFNFFFLPPVGALTIQDPQNWVALFAFLVTAVTASQLSSAARSRAREAERRREEVMKLYHLSRAIIATPDSETAVSSIARQVVEVFDLDYCGVLAPDEIGQWHRLAVSAELLFRPDDAMIERAFKSGIVLISNSPQDASEGMRDVAYGPLKMGARPIGVLVLRAQSLEENTVEAIAGLTALALERARFLKEVSRTEALKQSERLKSALLDAVTHDVRTPLTSIKASVTTLLNEPAVYGEGSLDDEGRREMLEVIDEEADRLNRFLEGLLEMARIEAGEMHLNPRLSSIDEIVLTALERAESLTRGHIVKTSLEADLPLVRVDARAVTEVIFTLLDNASKYSPAGSTIMVSAGLAGDDTLRVTVEDEGPGVARDLRERIFDKFFRVMRDGESGAPRTPPGMGMGLAIARAIVEAHGGRIWIEDTSLNRGARFAFTLRIEETKTVTSTS